MPIFLTPEELALRREQGLEGPARTAALELILRVIQEAEKGAPLLNEWVSASDRVAHSEPEDWEPDDWEMAAMLLRRRSTPDAVRATLVKRLAGVFDKAGWRFKAGNMQHVAAKAALLERAHDEHKTLATVRREALASAVYTALYEDETPQEIKLGEKWQTGATGHKVEVEPNQLYPEDFWRWLRTKVYAIATRDLAGDDYKGREDKGYRTPLNAPRIMYLSEDGAGAELGREALRAAQSATVRDVFALLENLPPRQREIADLLSDGKETNEIATLLGCTRSTVYNHVSTLKRKFHEFLISDKDD